MRLTNNPTIDNIIIWHGFGYPHSKSESYDSLCRVRIWQQKPIIVLFTVVKNFMFVYQTIKFIVNMKMSQI